MDMPGTIIRMMKAALLASGLALYPATLLAQPENLEADAPAGAMSVPRPTVGWSPKDGTALPAEIADAALAAAPVWDGHNDVPIQLRGRYRNMINGFDFRDTSRTSAVAGMDPDHAFSRPLHTDLVRLRQGRVGAQFWSVYVSAELAEPDAVRASLEQIDVTRRLIARHSEDLAFVRTADEVKGAMAQGRIASLLGIEGGHAIGSSLGVLRQMHQLGVRYMTLTHNRNTPWADSATDAQQHGGLTDFGRDVVREMNRIGMLADLSHASEETMLDALEVARAPVIFSHSGARAINAHVRNVPDRVLDRLPANGGIVMVVALPAFVSELRRQWGARLAGEEARLKMLHNKDKAMMAAGLREWRRANPEPVVTISDLADHVEHIARRIGVEHIGIGGDYDGMPTGPQGMEDVAGYPALFAELAERGFSQAELEMIASGNMMRVLRTAEDYAAARATDQPIEHPVPE